VFHALQRRVAPCDFSGYSKSTWPVWSHSFLCHMDRAWMTARSSPGLSLSSGTVCAVRLRSAQEPSYNRFTGHTHDSTHLKAHRTASSLLEKGMFPRLIGGAQKARCTSRLHAVVDGQGRPVLMCLTAGHQ